MSDGTSPKPWATMAGAPWNVLDATGRRIAWCNGDDYNRPSTPEDEANAALMAKAPELLGDIQKLREAVEAVLMFHSAGPWDTQKLNRWDGLTKHAEATTKGLCDYLRECLEQSSPSTT